MPFDTAINQTKQKNYPSKLADYTGDILLVGINYDKETKEHTYVNLIKIHPDLNGVGMAFVRLFWVAHFTTIERC